VSLIYAAARHSLSYSNDLFDNTLNNFETLAMSAPGRKRKAATPLPRTRPILKRKCKGEDEPSETPESPRPATTVQQDAVIASNNQLSPKITETTGTPLRVIAHRRPLKYVSEPARTRIYRSNAKKPPSEDLRQGPVNRHAPRTIAVQLRGNPCLAKSLKLRQKMMVKEQEDSYVPVSRPYMI
jgi:hypothetical protein